MSIEVFLVIPSVNPEYGDALTGDRYFTPATFPNAAILQIDDYDFGVENASSIGSQASGAGAGKAQFSSLVVRRRVSRASSYLFTASAEGTHLNAIKLYIRRPGGPSAGPFLSFEFRLVLVTKIEWSGGSSTEDASETVTFQYGAMAMSYQPPANPDGSQVPVITGGWSQVANNPSVQTTLP